MHFSSHIAVLVAVAAQVQADVAGVFIVNCAPLTTQRSDPLVSPGVASGHVHAVIGGNAFSRSMSTPNAAEVANTTSCNVGIDHSNYWVPTLYHKRSDGKYDLVPFTGSNVYYLNRACNYTAGEASCPQNYLPLAFPEGFRMIAGDSSRRTYNDSDFSNKAIRIMCAGNSFPDQETNGMPTTECNTFRAEVTFPTCWDGINVDTPNHKDHVAYPDPAHGDYNGGICPASHPVGLISIFYEFFFTTNIYPDFQNLIWANSDTTGYGLHGDFINGWTNIPTLQNALNCVGQQCPINSPVANGGLRIGQNTPALIYPAIHEEEIGLNGPIASLPGQTPAAKMARAVGQKHPLQFKG